ncbi:MAG TPA: GIY-YIG nuclease family protein [Candidatus Lumbricidophila sp.]|nr:GIY-YIG nuclease family protein [Candidatus Lumbricidophila sp.]
MPVERDAPGPCALCGASDAVYLAGRWQCALCGWRVGDVPDPDLPLPQVHVVYYLRYANRVKIGTTMHPRARLAAIRHDTLLAFEPGDRTVERLRHSQFATIREGGEWFTATPELLAHIAAIAGSDDPWHVYARLVAAALSG